MVTTGLFAAAEVRATGTGDDRTGEGGVVHGAWCTCDWRGAWCVEKRGCSGVVDGQHGNEQFIK